MKLEVLLSCMYQNDFSIIEKSNLVSDVLIVNQCDSNGYFEEKQDNVLFRRFDTTKRGLSKSRNLAIKNATGDICLICDDDESFECEYSLKITNAFLEIPDADLIIFNMSNRPLKLGRRIKKLRYFDTFKVSSWQISFKRDSIVSHNILFDEKLGAGTGNGAGEENKFLMDCLKRDLKIYYHPTAIASVAQENSTWFNGFDKQFFINQGNTTRYIMGFIISFLYAFYFCLTHKNMFIKQISVSRALIFTLKGVFQNKLKS